ERARIGERREAEHVIAHSHREGVRGDRETVFVTLRKKRLRGLSPAREEFECRRASVAEWSSSRQFDRAGPASQPCIDEAECRWKGEPWLIGPRAALNDADVQRSERADQR